MTRINYNGRIIDFPGPIEVEVRICPICSSHEVMRLTNLVPDTVLNDNVKTGFICLECDAVYPDEHDLNTTTVVYHD